uniref:SET domain-containing protein n=1 Tax=Heterorhabditis bacteriophora TaxID=37862 RepID=A0A1I7WG48_HETBA
MIFLLQMLISYLSLLFLFLNNYDALDGCYFYWRDLQLHFDVLHEIILSSLCLLSAECLKKDLMEFAKRCVSWFELPRNWLGETKNELLMAEHLTTWSITDQNNFCYKIREKFRLSVHEHSCSPNSYLIFNSEKVKLRTPNPNIFYSKELKISYIDLMQSTTRRRCELKSRYNIDCMCPVCTDEERVRKLLLILQAYFYNTISRKKWLVLFEHLVVSLLVVFVYSMRRLIPILNFFAVNVENRVCSLLKRFDAISFNYKNKTKIVGYLFVKTRFLFSFIYSILDFGPLLHNISLTRGQIKTLSTAGYTVKRIADVVRLLRVFKNEVINSLFRI